MRPLLQYWVTEQADRRPDSTALVMNHERLTYLQLESASNQLARLLRAAGCRRGDRICFLMPKSPTAIVIILGILKADCMYVPLDPSSPAPRIQKILESCKNRWILAAGPVAGLLDSVLADEKFRRSISVGWLDVKCGEGQRFRPEFSLADLAVYSSEPLDSTNDSEDPAHILFTSGSTGIPKGVVITHSNVIHFIEWAVKYFGISPADRISGHPPLHFDLSTFDIFGTFAAGAELHLVPAEVSILPNKLADFIRTSELTQWFSVPSVLQYMAKFAVLSFIDIPTLKRVLWCGEVFPTSGLIYWMKRLPHARFTNLYGPTETTIASSYYTLPKCPENEREPIPIGTACYGEGLFVLDQDLRPTPRGETGNLFIRGVGLSPGYWRDPVKTSAAFLPFPGDNGSSERIYRTGDLAKVGQDGLVYFVGRADTQIKSRGYRIELGEIEAALTALDGLKQSAVVAIETQGFEGKMICCAYSRLPQVSLSPTELRTRLSQVLPSYMLPARWMAFDQLPSNVNGKIDRKRLQQIFEENELQGRQPPLAQEHAVAAIAEEELRSG